MSYIVEFENGYMAEFENEPTDADIDEVARSLQQPQENQNNLGQIASDLADELGLNERYQQAVKTVDETFARIKSEPTGVGKVAAGVRGLKRGVFDVVALGFEPLARSVGEGIKRIGEAYSHLPGMEWLATRPQTEWTLNKVSEAYESLSKFSQSLEQKYPDIARDVVDLGEAILLAVGAKPAQMALQESKT